LHFIDFGAKTYAGWVLKKEFAVVFLVKAQAIINQRLAILFASKEIK